MRYQNFLFNKGVIGTRLNTFVRASFYWILYFLTVYGNMIILFDTNTIAWELFVKSLFFTVVSYTGNYFQDELK